MTQHESYSQVTAPDLVLPWIQGLVEAGPHVLDYLGLF